MGADHVQVTFDNFGHAIQDGYATIRTTTPPVSNPVAFNARGDELLGCFLLGRVYSATIRGGASRGSFFHDALINLGLSNSANAARDPAHERGRQLSRGPSHSMPSQLCACSDFGLWPALLSSGSVNVM